MSRVYFLGFLFHAVLCQSCIWFKFFFVVFDLMRKLGFLRQFSASSSRGVVLPLLALLIGILIAVTALVIDISIMSNAQQQYQSYARLAALSAIEGYFSSGENAELDRKSVDALAKANDILKHQYGIADPSGGKSYASLSPYYALSQGVLSDADAAQLQWGYWSYDSSDCSAGGVTPCFVSQDTTGSVQVQDSVNAFRVTGLFPSINLTGFSSYAFGRDYSEAIRVDAIATVVARHGCFLVDISNSVIRDTHTLQGPTDGGGNIKPEFLAGTATAVGEEYVFLLTDDNSGEFSDSQYDTLYSGGDGGWGLFSPLDASSGSQYHTRGANQGEPKVHYGDDYVRVKTFGDAARAHIADVDEFHPPATGEYALGGSDGLFYRVDTYRDPATVPLASRYRGPEPLRTIFQGLRSAVQGFKERRVSGDKLCLVFYDQSFSWPRIVLPTDDFDYLLELTDFALAGGIPLANESSGVDISGSTGLLRTIRHGLFPGMSPLPPASTVQRSWIFTDTPRAVTEALTMLEAAKDPLIKSSDFLVLIGDGLTNCYTNSLGNQSCNNIYDHHKESVNALESIIANRVIGNDIRVHALLVGDSVGPHTVRVEDPDESGSGKCLSDIDYRGRREEIVRQIGLISYALGGKDDGADGVVPYASAADISSVYEQMVLGNTRYYEVNRYLYEIVASTKGIYAPLRPSPLGCSVVDLERDCNSSIKRQLNDPQCRTFEEQMDDYIEEIITDNPFVIVDIGG